MNANWVHETSTTTGTGNITLAGAATDMRTFTSQFDTDVRFNYIIDGGSEKESGIGYLSGSTTLVREVVTNSTNSDALVSFSAGTKEVLCGPSADAISPNTFTTLSNGDVIGNPTALGFPSGATTTADRLMYIPFYLDYSGLIDGIGVSGNGTGGDILVALYSLGGGGLPGERIVGGTALQTAASALVIESITAQTFPVGWYWFAFWTDAAISINTLAYQDTIQTNMTGMHSNGTKNAWLGKTGVTSLTTLPDTATAPTSAGFAEKQPLVVLRPV